MWSPQKAGIKRLGGSPWIFCLRHADRGRCSPYTRPMRGQPFFGWPAGFLFARTVFPRPMTDYPTDPRRKRILYRATHRGTKEADAIIGGYFTAAAAGIADEDLAEAEEFLELPDLDLID